MTSSNRRPALEESADAALTNIASDLKEAEESLPSVLYRDTMDRVMVAKNELKRKRDEKYVKVMYKILTAIAVLDSDGDLSVKFSDTCMITGLFRLVETRPAVHGLLVDMFFNGMVMQVTLDCHGFTYANEHWFIMSHEPVEV